MRLRLGILLAFLIGLVDPVAADSGITYVALGYQQITTVSSATKLTVPTGATTAFIAVEGQAVRYRDDGTAPTAAVGMPVPVGTTLQYSGPLINIQFIEQVGGAKLNISYYR